jgi:putative nucleotidyltransferase with HDIG domain
MPTAQKEQSQDIPGFISIPVRTLQSHLVTDFALWHQPRPGAPLVLYRGPDQPFTEEVRDRLEAHNVSRLYVPIEDRNKLRLYIEQNMEQLLGDSSLPVEQRSEMMYESAQGLVRDALEDPRSVNLMQRCSDTVPHMIDFLYKEGQSFSCLLKVCSHDYYTYTHSVNVFTYGIALAHHMGFTRREVEMFGQGALLHDIGKSGLPLDVIHSPTCLTDDQWELMRQHPVIGYDILVEQGVKQPVVLDVTRHHHEKLNGKGYPDRLAGKEISVFARMCTIADIFDALTTRRSYKEARRSFESLQFMRAHMSDEIDMEIFKAFVELMGQQEASKER